MNILKTYATRLAMAAVVTALGAGLTTGAMAQGTVTLSNTTGNTCSYSSMTVQPNGNIAVACNSANPVPTCTISGPTQVNTGASATLTANCTNSPTSYVWAISPAPPGPTFVSPNSPTLTGTLPDGSYNFTVTAANGNGTGPTSAQYGVTFGTPSTPPTCTAASASPNPINVGDNATLSATCTGASTYTWTLTSSPAGSSATNSATTNGATVTGFTVAGVYRYQLTASNAAGPTTSTAAPYVVDITVNSVSSGTCATIATVPPVNGNNIYNLRFDLKPGVIGSFGFDWPLASDPDKTKIRMFWVKGTSSETPVGTQTQITISPCPGQMTTTTPACTWSGWSGGSFYVGAGTACTLTAGQKYYINVKQSTLSGGNCVPTGTLGINYCTSYVQGTPL